MITTSDEVSFHLFCIGSSLKLFSPKLYIISLAWLGFEIALLKRLNLQLDRKNTHLRECLLILMGPIWNFLGGPNSLSHGSDFYAIRSSQSHCLPLCV